jgi:uncharacterized protein YhbP (UPF0306 family)
MNEAIIHFIKQQTCATICCVDEQGKPYCFSCYYAFNREEGLLYFKSSADSHHSALMKINPFLAGTILPDKLNTLLVKGVQFEAIVLNEHDPLSLRAPGYYHKKYPIALAIPGEIRTIQINCIKMTDSTMGFGKKITWNRDEKAIGLGRTDK